MTAARAAVIRPAATPAAPVGVRRGAGDGTAAHRPMDPGAAEGRPVLSLSKGRDDRARYGGALRKSPCACGGGCPRCRASPSLQGADARPPTFDTPRGDAKAAGVRFAGRRAACPAPYGFRITMDTNENDVSAATGRLHVAFTGEGLSRFHGGTQQPFAFGTRGKNDEGKVCDCDCMTYRQHIRGVAFRRGPADAAFQAETQIVSGHRVLPLDGQWHEEDVSTIIGRSAQGCEHEYEDHPGVIDAQGNGTMWLVRLNFLLQVWDRCMQRSVRESQQTLSVGGDEPPRWIHWDGGWLPLTREDLRMSYAMDGQPASQAAGTSAGPGPSPSPSPGQ